MALSVRFIRDSGRDLSVGRNLNLFYSVIDIDVKTESIDEKENNYTKQKMLPC